MARKPHTHTHITITSANTDFLAHSRKTRKFIKLDLESAGPYVKIHKTKHLLSD